MNEFFIITLAVYGFYTAVQMLRGNHLNFKPFNCKLCISFWVTILYVAVFSFTLSKIVILPFAVSGAVYLIGIIEDRLTYYKEGATKD